MGKWKSREKLETEADSQRKGERRRARGPLEAGKTWDSNNPDPF